MKYSTTHPDKIYICVNCARPKKGNYLPEDWTIHPGPHNCQWPKKQYETSTQYYYCECPKCQPSNDTGRCPYCENSTYNCTCEDSPAPDEDAPTGWECPSCSYYFTEDEIEDHNPDNTFVGCWDENKEEYRDDHCYLCCSNICEYCDGHTDTCSCEDEHEHEWEDESNDIEEMSKNSITVTFSCIYCDAHVHRTFRHDPNADSICED